MQSKASLHRLGPKGSHRSTRSNHSKPQYSYKEGLEQRLTMLQVMLFDNRGRVK